MLITLAFVTILPIIFGQNNNNKFSNCTEIGKCFQECKFDDDECDLLPKLPSDLNGKILFYTTSQNGDKFIDNYTEWKTEMNNSNNINFNIEIDTNKQYQTILGFGAAITDSTIINLNELPNNKLINDILISYFSSDIGSGYRTGRVPIASCDFSPYSYSYAPKQDDFKLEYFNLTVQDFGNSSFIGRIEIIQEIKQIIIDNDNKENLFLFSTPWSPPIWMKTNNGYYGGNFIDNDTYLETYSLYFIKYLSLYKEYGNITFGAITPQNEPHSPSPWESCQWTTKLLSKFIAKYLGPKLHSFDDNIQIWIYDGQKGFLPEEGYEYFLSSDTVKYINGLAFHWYVFPPPTPGCLTCDGSFKNINKMYEYIDNNDNNDILFIGTEACQGFSDIESPPKRGVSLGNINRGQQYAEDIIGDIINNVSSWNDWNMVLNINGGPNHAGNFCDAPIIIDIENKKYYKQPMYYYLAHISKYMRPNSKRVELKITNNNKNKNILWFTGVIDNNTLNKTVIVLLNTDETEIINIQINDKRFGYMINTMPPKSIRTILYDNFS